MERTHDQRLIGYWSHPQPQVVAARREIARLFHEPPVEAHAWVLAHKARGHIPILGVTREIWEDRGIHSLHRSYAPDIVVRSPASVVVGNSGVVAATLSTLYEFPDRQLLGEDVIWTEAPGDAFLSSHRLISTATHLGNGAYGPATGRRVAYRIIADCHARAGTIDDEWLVRDQGGIVRQLGLEPRDYARRLIVSQGGPEQCVQPLSPANDRPGPYVSTGNENAWAERHADLLRRLMAADFAAVPQVYDRAVELLLPGAVTEHGWSMADRFWLGLRAAFPDAAFTIHHAMGREDPGHPPRTALRWSLWGCHAGWGAFGAPTGAEVYVLGLSHAEWGPWGLRRDWTLYDETALWTQILLHAGEI